MTYEDSLYALADPTRRKIIEVLRQGPKSVGEIARLQTVSRPAVSQHLRVLETASLVSVSVKGNRRIYEIQLGGLGELHRWLMGFWADSLSAYAQEVDRQISESKGH
jgi:DNA-binding transcriptional ArsR family regulator